MKTTLYICADSTLTYGPYGGRQKIVEQALPIAVVKDEATARNLIVLVGRRAYNDPEADPDFKVAMRGKPIPEGYGPDWRYYYSLPDFEVGNVETVQAVRERMEGLIKKEEQMAAEPHRRLPPRERLIRMLGNRLLALNEDESRDRAWLKHTDGIGMPVVPDGFEEYRDTFMQAAESSFKAGYTLALTDVTEWLTGQLDG